MDKKIVLRQIFPHVLEHLAEKEITLIIGPRQVGKTTLALQLKDFLITQNQVSSEDIYYFNLDVVSDRSIFQTQTDFIQFIKNRISGRNKLYIFIDEAQRIINAGLFFKGVYDLNLPVKMILTGSSSLDIRAKVMEPLTGRKRLFKLFPLSFEEYISFKDSTLVPYMDKKDKFAQEKLLEYLFTFIIFGGYPKVILGENLSQKIDYLEEIYTSYVEKDVVGFLRIRDSFVFTKLVKILSEEVGNLFSVQKTSRELQIKNQTVRNYLSALENTFIAKRALPFFRTTRAEIRKMPKIYFYDTGLRNFVKEMRDFSLKSFKERQDAGILLENFIFTELLKSNISEVNFWRTKDGAEVDFILHKKGEIIPIEVKATRLKKQSLSRSFVSFLQKYTPKIGIIVNLYNQSIGKFMGTEVHYLLPYQLLGLLREL